VPTSLGLSTSEVTQLQAALKTLLSPLDFESLGAWRAEARKAIGALIRAETSVSFLPIEGETPYQADRQIDLAHYAEHFHTMDKTTRYYRATGTHAFTWQTMRPTYERPDRAAWLKSEFYNDWVRPQRLCQPCGLIAVRLPAELPCPPFESFSGLAGLWFYWDRDGPAATGERELTILQVLLPAFEAGLHLVVRCAQERQRVAHVLATLGEGAMLVHASGRVLYENPALQRMLAQDAEERRLLVECTRMGRVVLALAGRRGAKSHAQEIVAPGEQRLRTAAGSYRVRGTLLGPGVLGSGPMALVVLERTTPETLAFTDLHDRYQLTQREAAVSRLLAQGHTNAEVARLLGISIHTARRHAERVLMKLGVHSRAAVAGKLVTD
jgi:DNA-binding CsgD family transcriptional regulator